MQVRPAKPTAGVYDEEAADKESPRESLGSMLPRTESDVPGVLDMMEFDLDEKDDIHRMFRPSTKLLKLRDKVVFMVGAMNLMILAYFSGRWPWLMPYYFSVKFPILMAIRTYTFVKQDWGYFMLDWCYFANIMLLAFLWTPLRHNPNVFTAMFCIAHGPLPWAVLLFRNSLVFHSLERITSCFIHISPMLVMWSLRWHGADFEASHQWAVCDPATGGALPTAWSNNNTFVHSSSCGSMHWSLGMPVAAYLGWFALYGLLMLILQPDLARFSTTYTHMTRKGLGAKLRALPAGWLLYVIVNTSVMAVMVAPTALLLRYEQLNFGFVCLIGAVASWNGGSFYVEVFSRKYQAQLAAAGR